MLPTDQTVRTAMALHQAGNFVQAEEMYRQTLLENPRQVDAWHLLGVLLNQTGRIEQALDHLLTARTLLPNNAVILLNLGLAYVHLGQNAAAAATFRDAIACDQGWAVAHINLGHALLALDRLDEAEASYQRGIQLDPRSIDAHNNIASIWHRRGRFETAAASYRAALEIEPNYVPALNNLGNIFRTLGQPAQAAEYYRRCLQVDPNCAQSYNNLALALRDLGQISETHACLQQAVRLAPQMNEAVANLADLLRDLNQPDQARQILAEALAKRPADALRIKRALILSVIPHSVEEIHQERQRMLDELRELLAVPLCVRDPVTEISIMAFYQAYHGLDDLPLAKLYAQVAVHATPSLNFVAPHCRDAASPPR